MKLVSWLELVTLIITAGMIHLILTASEEATTNKTEPRASMIKTSRWPNNPQPIARPLQRRPSSPGNRPYSPDPPQPAPAPFWSKSDDYHQPDGHHYSGGGGYHHGPMHHYSSHHELGFLKPLILFIVIPIGILLVLGTVFALVQSTTSSASAGVIGQQQQQQQADNNNNNNANNNNDAIVVANTNPSYFPNFPFFIIINATGRATAGRRRRSHSREEEHLTFDEPFQLDNLR